MRDRDDVTTPGRYAAWIAENRLPVAESIRRVRPYLLASAALLAAGFAVALVWYEPTASGGSGGTDQAVATLSAVDIAVNNLFVTVTFASGWVLLGMPTVAGLVFNGYLLGSLSRELVAIGNDPVVVALYVVPHGMFEIPGLLLAATVGLVPPVRLAQYVAGRRDRILDAPETVALVELFALAVVLICVGAAVETRATGAIARTLLGGG